MEFDFLVLSADSRPLLTFALKDTRDTIFVKKQKPHGIKNKSKIFNFVLKLG